MREQDIDQQETREDYETPQFHVVELEQVIRGIGGSHLDGDNTPTSFI